MDLTSFHRVIHMATEGHAWYLTATSRSQYFQMLNLYPALNAQNMILLTGISPLWSPRTVSLFERRRREKWFLNYAGYSL